MKIESRLDDRVTVFRLSGHLDAHEAPLVRSHFLNAVADGQIALVVNLAAVSFVDSAGLAALVQGMKQAREAGGDMLLCELQTAVHVILELAGLHMAFRVYAREISAVAALRQQRQHESFVPET